MTFRTIKLELVARAEFEAGDQVEIIQDNQLYVGVVAGVVDKHYIQVIVPIDQAAARTPGADLSNTNCAIYVVERGNAWRRSMRVA